jgi:hypothetical protein
LNKKNNELILIFSFAFLFILVLSISYNSQRVLSESPSFRFEEIKDPFTDWFNLDSKNYSKDGIPSTDILSVNYLSDGNMLNSTLWLSGPFDNSPVEHTGVNYGMYIDADFDKQTGYGGIDYKLEIAWDNDTKSWTKILEKWSPNGDTKTISLEKNHTGFFEKDKKFVEIPLELRLLDFPPKYKIAFYAEAKIRASDPLITDFTKWVVVPPLELTIATSPPVIELTKGKEKTIEVQVNSSQGYEPRVELSATNQTNSIENISFQNKSLNIPTYGIAATPLTIKATQNSATGTNTMILFANSTFPSKQLIDDLGSNDTHDFVPDMSENVFAKSSVLVTIVDPPSWDESIKTFWDNIGGATLFIYGIFAGLVPWIYTSMKNRKKKNHG